MATSQGLRSDAIRRENLASVLRHVRLGGPASRTALVQATGLSRSAMADLIGELVDLGLVMERPGPVDGSPGRPSPIVEVDDQRNAVIGVDLLVDTIGVGLVALSGTVLRGRRRERSRTRTAPEDSLAAATEMVRAVMTTMPSGTRVHGIGIALPGLVRHGDRQLVVAPNLEGWRGLDVGAALGLALASDLPAIVDNDGNLGGLAESRRGAGLGATTLLYLSGEVGVGGGIVSDGEVMSGSRGFAGEIGHVLVNPTGTTCACGAVGCLESEVGEEALLARLGRPPKGGRRAVLEVLSDAADGDAAVLEVLREHGRWLGLGLAGLVNVLDPDVVVLGGMLGELHPYLVTTAAEVMAQRQLGHGDPPRPLLRSTLGEDATIVGAAERVWDQVLADPAALGDAH